MPDDEGSLGELLEEAFCRGAVDVEEERVRNREQREEGDERPHAGGDSLCRALKNLIARRKAVEEKKLVRQARSG